MCMGQRKCQAWISLLPTGLPYEGCLRDPGWLLSIEVLCCQSLCTPSVYVEMPGIGLRCVETVSQGAYGLIDYAVYEWTTSTGERQRQEVYVKRPILRGRNLMMEACIQMKARECLERAGFEEGAPEVVRIFRLSNRSVCFAMKPIEGACTLDRYLQLEVPPDRVTHVLVECLLQLSSIMWHLGHDIGINHRDLKPSNFLVTPYPVPRRKIITVDTEVIELPASRYGLTLIDFGFACIGLPETQVSSLSLGSMYSTRDPCPKEGRDLFLFLALLYMDVHTLMDPILRGYFERWLNFAPDFCNELRRPGGSVANTRWIYGIASHESLHEFPCCPLQVVRDLLPIYAVLEGAVGSDAADAADAGIQ